MASYGMSGKNPLLCAEGWTVRSVCKEGLRRGFCTRAPGRPLVQGLVSVSWPLSPYCSEQLWTFNCISALSPEKATKTQLWLSCLGRELATRSGRIISHYYYYYECYCSQDQVIWEKSCYKSKPSQLQWTKPVCLSVSLSPCYLGNLSPQSKLSGLSSILVYLRGQKDSNTVGVIVKSTTEFISFCEGLTIIQESLHSSTSSMWQWE